jgi:hypothetical protein
LIADSVPSLAVQVNKQKRHDCSIETTSTPVKQTPRCIEESEYPRGPCQLLELICGDHVGGCDSLRRLSDSLNHPLDARLGISFDGRKQVGDWIEVDAKGWAVGDTRDIRDRPAPAKRVKHCAACRAESLNSGSGERNWKHRVIGP